MAGVMTVRNHQADSYFLSHAAQLPVLNNQGQERLRHARVHVSGTGRIGGSIVMHLAEAGIGEVSANDPQGVEQENFGPWAFVRPPDLGKKKVLVLWRYFQGRPHFLLEPLVAPTESKKVDPFIRRAQLVVSCANTVGGRLAAERKAIKYRKPVMQIAAFDGRERLGGLIALRLPENRWSACFGCYLNDKQKFPRGEGLLATVTSTLAAMAANVAVQLLAGVQGEFPKENNLFLIDLHTYTIEALAVKRRSGCSVCGSD
jgi:molybdopterin/thiamine biosynthesis adenylyltransferase